MISHRALVALWALTASPVFAQAASVPITQSASMSMVAPALTPILLRRDTPIELMATKEVSTADVVPGTRFKLRVNQPVTVAGKIIIPTGASAFGEVITAEDSGGLGKSGRMTARLLYIELGKAEIPLDGQTSAKGTGAGSAGVAILFTGWAGFFHRGNNAKIKAGELLNGFIAEDTWLDLAANPVERVASPPLPPPLSPTPPPQ